MGDGGAGTERFVTFVLPVDRVCSSEVAEVGWNVHGSCFLNLSYEFELTVWCLTWAKAWRQNFACGLRMAQNWSQGWIHGSSPLSSNTNDVREGSFCKRHFYLFLLFLGLMIIIHPHYMFINWFENWEFYQKPGHFCSNFITEVTWGFLYPGNSELWWR